MRSAWNKGDVMDEAGRQTKSRTAGGGTAAGAAVGATGGGQLMFESLDDEERGYRGPTVCDIVGITYRQLDYWARTDLVTPSMREAQGSGTQRLYSFDDLVQLRVIKGLLDTGVSLRQVREAIAQLREQGQQPGEVTLVSDGSTVYGLDDNADVIDLLSRGQGVFAIALGPLVKELRGDVADFPSEQLSEQLSEESQTESDQASTKAI